MDKLQAIRYFLKLSETLSFKGTALHFGVPASTVSRSIKALEKEFGATLVERTTRSVRLTETGDWYRTEVAGPIQALSHAEEMVAEHAKEAKGRVRITAMVGYGEICLNPVLERFRARYPEIVCDVELSDRYLDMSNGEVDVALRATADPPDNLVARRLHDHGYVLVASPAYLEKHGRPADVGDMEGHSTLAYRGAAGVLDWFAVSSNGTTRVVPRQDVLITNKGLDLLRAAVRGEGFAFLPRWGVARELEEGALEEVTFDGVDLTCRVGPEVSVYLLYQPKKVRLGQVRALVDFLREELEEKQTQAWKE